MRRIAAIAGAWWQALHSCSRADCIARVAFQRHDYEGVSSAGGEQVMRNLEAKLVEAQAGAVAEVAAAENFS